MDEIQYYHNFVRDGLHIDYTSRKRSSFSFTVAYTINPEYMKYAFAFLNPREKSFVKRIGRDVAKKNLLSGKVLIKSIVKLTPKGVRYKLHITF